MFGSLSYFGHFPASCATLSQLSRPPDVPGLGWAGLAWVELVGPAWVGLDWGPARFAMARATLSSGPPQGSGRHLGLVENCIPFWGWSKMASAVLGWSKMAS